MYKKKNFLNIFHCNSFTKKVFSAYLNLSHDQRILYIFQPVLHQLKPHVQVFFLSQVDPRLQVVILKKFFLFIISGFLEMEVSKMNQ